MCTSCCLSLRLAPFSQAANALGFGEFPLVFRLMYLLHNGQSLAYDQSDGGRMVGPRLGSPLACVLAVATVYCSLKGTVEDTPHSTLEAP